MHRWPKIWGWLMGILFAYSAASKFLDLSAFQSALLGLQFLAVNLIVPLSIAIPTVELIVAVMLFLPEGRKLGFIVSMVLIFTFSFGILFASTYGNDVVCGCFGDYSKIYLPVFFLRNTFLLLGCWFGFTRLKKNI